MLQNFKPLDLIQFGTYQTRYMYNQFETIIVTVRHKYLLQFVAIYGFMAVFIIKRKTHYIMCFQEKISGEPSNILSRCHRAEHQPGSYLLWCHHTACQPDCTGQQVSTDQKLDNWMLIYLQLIACYHGMHFSIKKNPVKS